MTLDQIDRVQFRYE